MMADRQELEKSVRQENIKGFNAFSDALAGLDESLFAYLIGVPGRIFDEEGNLMN